MSKREEGYYWVHVHGDWYAAKYDKDNCETLPWEVFGCAYDEHELKEIDERRIVREPKVEITNKGSGDIKEYLDIIDSKLGIPRDKPELLNNSSGQVEFTAEANKENLDMFRCVNASCTAGGKMEIECKLGLWSVSGDLVNLKRIKDEARYYWEQYKADGEYHSIIGGPSPVDILINNKR